jgi:hypothetical protein
MKHLRMVTVVFATALGLAGFYSNQASTKEPHKHGEHFEKCAKACADCQVACDSCFHHCAGLVAQGKKEHAKTMHSCVDCAAFCELAGRLSARHSAYAVRACDGCAKTCDDCAKECEKFPDDKHMKDCAKSCRDCAKACRTMIEHVKH